jgi:CRISPR-associated protein Cas2
VGLRDASDVERSGRRYGWTATDNGQLTTDRGKMDTFLVTYDICEPKRLRKVAKVCEDFGLRRQYSVFFCRLAAVDLVRLKSRLYDVVNVDRDQVLFIPLCARCASAIEAVGKPIEPHDARDVVIVS